MQWNKHFELEGKHAFLSPSGYHWLNYTKKKLQTVYANHKRKEKGTALHAFAEMAIRERIKLANHKQALNMFVNDAIGFDMEPEQVLYYSDHCFGTADAIKYEKSDNPELKDLLRIHDLKTGITKASFNQLLVYAALFCLEYRVNPVETAFVGRIYQGTGFEEIEFMYDEVIEVMNTIQDHSRSLDEVME